MGKMSKWNLLVAVTALLVIWSLFVMSVPRERVNTRAYQCASRLKNFSLAAVQHDYSRNCLPGYVQNFGTFSGDGSDRSDPTNNGAPHHKKLGTWAVALLPWLDAQPTYEHWTQDRYPILIADPRNPPRLGSTSGSAGNGFHALASRNLSTFRCPSSPVDESQNAPNSMIYNNGLAWPPDRPPLGMAPHLKNGVGNSKYNVTKIDPKTGKGIHTGEAPNIGLDDLTDGKSCTILFSENIQALPWHRLGLIHGADLIMKDPDQKDVKFNRKMPKAHAAQYTQGMVWHYEDTEAANLKLAPQWNKLSTTAPVIPKGVAPVHRINGCMNGNRESLFNLRILDAGSASDLARPSSAHRTGVNAAFADGSTRFIDENIDYRVYQALMTPSGKTSSVPYPRFVPPPQFR